MQVKPRTMVRSLPLPNGRAVASVVALFAILVSFVVATSAMGQQTRSDTQMSIRDYRQLMDAMRSGDEGSGGILYFFFFGLRSALTASGEAYAANGARKRICMPSDLRTFDMFAAIELELERNAAVWKDQSEADIGLVANRAFAHRWPCR